MITEHPTHAHLNRYRERTLDPAELLTMDRHLAVCPPCRTALSRVLNANEQVVACRERLTDHLTYQQVAGSVEGRVEAAAEAHLQVCASCREEVDDLRAFRARLPRPRAAWVLPAWVAAAAAVIVLAGIGVRSGKRPVLHAPAQHAVAAETPLTVEQRQVIATLRATPKLGRAPVLDELISRRGVLLGESSETRSFELTAPVGTEVLQDRPAFRWQPVSGASHYVVSVFDQNFRLVAESPALTAPEWQAAAALPRGQVLVWQVTATIGADTVRAPVPPAPEARFEIADAATASAIEQARRDHPRDHLLLAGLLARNGALDEAAAEIDALGATDPDLARALGSSLAEIRGR